MIDDQQKDNTPPVEVSPGQPTTPVSESALTTDILADNEIEVNEDADPSVSTELLELHVELEERGVSPEKFQATYGGGAA